MLEARHHSYASPQNFALEVRIAQYVPNIDAAPGLGGPNPSSPNAPAITHPYGDIFGPSPRLEVAVEFDWQALRIPHFGTLGPGLSAGYTSIGAKAKILGTNTDSAEDTNLNIYPFYGVAVVRADVLLRELKIPIVPYAKGGDLEKRMALWQATNSVNGSSTNIQGRSSEGHTFGTHLALGAAFALDVFDETATTGTRHAGRD